MSISASLSSFEYEDRKINLVDTPGDPSFVADALGALSVCESAVFCVNGVMGVEVSTARLWERADGARPRAAGVREHARPRARRLLPHARLAQGGVRPARRRDRDPDRLRARGARHRRPDRHEGVRVRGRRARRARPRSPIPAEIADQAQEYREKLMDEVAENSDDLMERYLEGEEISHDEIVSALKEGVTAGTIFPVTCGVATKNLGTDRLLDALVQDLPSPAKKGAVKARDARGQRGRDRAGRRRRADRLRVQDARRPVRGAHQPVPRPTPARSSTTRSSRTCARTRRSASASCSSRSGKEMGHADEFGAGDIGAVAKLKETHSGDVLAGKESTITLPPLGLPGAVMAFAIEAKSKGDEDKIGDARSAACRRRTRRSTSTATRRPGEQIIAGLSQVHVEVIVERMKNRFGAEVILKPPRVPYQETIKGSAKAQGRYKKQTGGRGQFGDCHIELEPLPQGGGLRVRQQDQGRRDPDRLHSRRGEGRRRGDADGRRGGLSAARRAGDPLRRLLPLGRLVRERVQGRRLDGVQEGRGAGAADAARADHAGCRWSCPRTRWAT